MPFTTELLKEIYAATISLSQKERAKADYIVGKAEEILREIPKIVADAHYHGQDHAILCQVFDAAKKFRIRCEGIGAEFRFPTVKDSWFAKSIKPEWLNPVAKIVYDQCLTLGLSPHFSQLSRWSDLTKYSDLTLSWQREHLTRLLSPLTSEDDKLGEEIRDFLTDGKRCAIGGRASRPFYGVFSLVRTDSDRTIYANGHALGLEPEDEEKRISVRQNIDEIERALSESNRQSRGIYVAGNWHGPENSIFVIDYIKFTTS